jgi:hypothetical protein
MREVDPSHRPTAALRLTTCGGRAKGMAAVATVRFPSEDNSSIFVSVRPVHFMHRSVWGTPVHRDIGDAVLGRRRRCRDQAMGSENGRSSSPRDAG